MKKFLIAAAAAVMCFGMTFHAAAAEKLEKPTVWWSTEPKEEGLAKWSRVENSGGKYKIELWRDDERIYSSRYSANITSKEESYDDAFAMSEISESGAYKFHAMALGDGQDRLDSDWSDWTPDYVYQRPSIQFGVPTDAKWVENKITWGMPTDGISQKYLDSAWGYEIELLKDGKGYSSILLGGIKSMSYDPKFDMLKDGTYTFRIRIISADIKTLAHGEWVYGQGQYSTSGESSRVNSSLEEILNEGGVAGAPDKLADNRDNVQIAMQTSEETRKLISELEDVYKSEKNITTGTNVSDDVALDADKITILGSGLNAKDPGGAVIFNVRKPEREVLIDETAYRNAMQVDFSLEGAYDEMKVPMWITVPIPEGMAISRFAVLHYHADGTYDDVKPLVIDAQNRTASFAVTRFSVFALAERGAAPEVVATPSDAKKIEELAETLPDSFSDLDLDEQRKTAEIALAKIVDGLGSNSIDITKLEESTVLKLDNLLGELLGELVTIAKGDDVDEVEGAYLAAAISTFENHALGGKPCVVRVRLADIASSSNAAKKLSFKFDISVEESERARAASQKSIALKAPLYVTITAPQSYSDGFQDADKLLTPDGKTLPLKDLMEGNSIRVPVTKLGTFTVRGTAVQTSSNATPSGSRSSASKDKSAGMWIADGNSWKFRGYDGVYFKNQWAQLDWNGVSDWYFFDADGFLKTGWYFDGAHWYYLHPNADGRRGHMYTGWQLIDGVWSYFYPQPGGPMGALAVSTTTPDGYAVDANGAWIQ